MNILGTKTFMLESTLRAQASKILEEASEASEAMREYEKETTDIQLAKAKSELADSIQTCLNAFAMLGCDKQEVLSEMNDCYQRNKARGRVD